MEANWRIRSYFPELSEDKLGALRIYHIELLRFNQTINLISNTTEKDADILHFFDSIKASEQIRAQTKEKKTQYYDFGSGNGFPGLVFSILNPELKVTAIDSDERKCEFIKHIASRAELKNLKVLQTKIEDLCVPTPSIVMCRALASLARTLLLSNKILKEKSIVYSMKGPDWSNELASLPNQICSTWNTKMSREYDLPESLGTRVVLASEKIQ